jgi:hypothetical protein
MKMFFNEIIILTHIQHTSYKVQNEITNCDLYYVLPVNFITNKQAVILWQKINQIAHIKLQFENTDVCYNNTCPVSCKERDRIK